MDVHELSVTEGYADPCADPLYDPSTGIFKGLPPGYMAIRHCRGGLERLHQWRRPRQWRPQEEQARHIKSGGVISRVVDEQEGANGKEPPPVRGNGTDKMKVAQPVGGKGTDKKQVARPVGGKGTGKKNSTRSHEGRVAARAVEEEEAARAAMRGLIADGKVPEPVRGKGTASVVTPDYQPNCMRCDGSGLGEPVCLACGALAPMAPQFWQGEFGEFLFKEGEFLAPLPKYLLERMWEERLDWHEERVSMDQEDLRSTQHEERMSMDHEDLRSTIVALIQHESASESESGGERV